jgi:hypothetical protein
MQDLASNRTLHEIAGASMDPYAPVARYHGTQSLTRPSPTQLETLLPHLFASRIEPTHISYGLAFHPHQYPHRPLLAETFVKPSRRRVHRPEAAPQCTTLGRQQPVYIIVAIDPRIIRYDSAPAGFRVDLFANSNFVGWTRMG